MVHIALSMNLTVAVKLSRQNFHSGIVGPICNNNLNIIITYIILKLDFKSVRELKVGSLLSTSKLPITSIIFMYID